MTTRGTGRAVPRRRGTVYIAILALGVLVLVLGVGGMLASRVEARGAFEASRAGVARGYAASAANLGRLWIAGDAAWRTKRANGAWITSAPFDQGTMSLDVVNPLGALGRSSLDPVVMTATGVCGTARQKLRLTLTARATALSCLNAVLCAGGDITVDGNDLEAPGLVVSTNGSITLQSGGAIVNGNVEASGSATGSTYSGTKKTGQAAKTMPTIANVLAEYALVGSAMSRASVPVSGGMLQFKNLLISPSSPAFGGAAQAQGVYILDCKGSAVSFDTIRVVGTVVLVDCGGLSIDGPVYMSPAVANYPCLVVQGSLTINTDAKVLKESSAGVNLNPASTAWPYPNGFSDAAQSDQYPCGIIGLTYISEDMAMNSRADWTFGPTVVGGNVNFKSKVINFVSCPECVAAPPPGFSSVSMVISGAAWEQAVD